MSCLRSVMSSGGLSIVTSPRRRVQHGGAADPDRQSITFCNFAILIRMRRDTVTTHLDVSPGQKRQLTPVDPDTPFRMVLVANFSAGQHRARKPIRVDFDNFEEVLARLPPQLELPGPDGPI